jgi:Thiolase, C-terminal domain
MSMSHAARLLAQLHACLERLVSRPPDFRTINPTLFRAHDTGADLAKINVNGGAIAIGHPLGASGARIMTTLINAREQRGGRYGLQTMCEGRGIANATIIQRLG